MFGIYCISFQLQALVIILSKAPIFSFLLGVEAYWEAPFRGHALVDFVVGIFTIDDIGQSCSCLIFLLSFYLIEGICLINKTLINQGAMTFILFIYRH